MSRTQEYRHFPGCTTSFGSLLCWVPHKYLVQLFHKYWMSLHLNSVRLRCGEWINLISFALQAINIYSSALYIQTQWYSGSKKLTQFRVSEWTYLRRSQFVRTQIPKILSMCGAIKVRGVKKNDIIRPMNYHNKHQCLFPPLQEYKDDSISSWSTFSRRVVSTSYHPGTNQITI